jgi:hypothetical protein
MGVKTSIARVFQGPTQAERFSRSFVHDSQLDWLSDCRCQRQGQIHHGLRHSLPVSKDTVADIVACGRARWKIENEGFNVMKNHGYALEHNFGHGKQFLAMILAAFNLLAFAWHSVLDLLEPPWQAAREAAAKRKRFFTNIMTLTAFVVFPSWPVFLKSLATYEIPPNVLQNEKIPQ